MQTTQSWLRRILPGPPQRQTQKLLQTSRPGEGRVWISSNGELSAVVVSLGATDGAHTVIRRGELTAGDAVVTGTARPRT